MNNTKTKKRNSLTNLTGDIVSSAQAGMSKYETVCIMISLDIEFYLHVNMLSIF